MQADRNDAARAMLPGSKDRQEADCAISDVPFPLPGYSGQARRGRRGQKSQVACFGVSAGERSVLHCEQVQDVGVGLQAGLQDSAVLLEFGVLSLKILERVCGAQVCGSSGFLLGDLGLEEIFEVGVLVSQVPAFDVRFDGQLGDVEPPVGTVRGSGEETVHRGDDRSPVWVGLVAARDSGH